MGLCTAKYVPLSRAETTRPLRKPTLAAHEWVVVNWRTGGAVDARMELEGGRGRLGLKEFRPKRPVAQAPDRAAGTPISATGMASGRISLLGPSGGPTEGD